MSDTYDIHAQPFKGWIDNQHEVEATLKTMPAPMFASAPGVEDMELDETKEVFLYQNTRAVIGGDAPKGPQKIGDCTSWGFSGFADELQCIQISVALHKAQLLGASKDEQDEFLKSEGIAIYEEIATEATYALLRVQVGGQKGSYSDGGVGAWGAKAATTFGEVSRPALVRAGMSGPYDPKRAKEWGAKGLPDALIPVGKEHIIKVMSLCTNFKDAAKAIQNGCPVVVCSNRGFTMTRDKQGFAAPQGVWQHCMRFNAVRWDRPGLCCMQNWGPNCPTGPLDKGQPDNSFWVDASVVDYMLGQKDSFTGSDLAVYYNKDVSIWHH